MPSVSVNSGKIPIGMGWFFQGVSDQKLEAN